MIGKVKKTNTGFKKVFNNAKTTATTKAALMVSTWIPGRKFANTTIRIVVNKSRINKFFIMIVLVHKNKKSAEFSALFL